MREVEIRTVILKNFTKFYKKGDIFVAFDKLKKKHRTAIELLLQGNLTIEEIAKSVKVTRQTLYNWMQDPLFDAELKEREADFRRVQKARITQLASKALDTQEQIMNKSKNDVARAGVASDVLDRAGYIKPKKAEDDNSDKRTGGVVILPDIEGENE